MPTQINKYLTPLNCNDIIITLSRLKSIRLSLPLEIASLGVNGIDGVIYGRQKREDFYPGSNRPSSEE